MANGGEIMEKRGSTNLSRRRSIGVTILGSLVLLFGIVGSLWGLLVTLAVLDPSTRFSMLVLKHAEFRNTFWALELPRV